MQDTLNLINFIGTYLDVLTLLICAGVGFILKNAVPKLNNQYIPLISGILGVVINTWAYHEFTPEIIATGLVSGLAATGMYELIRNMIDQFGKQGTTDNTKEGE